MLSLKQRMLYRSKLIESYFNKQTIKDMPHVKRQVVNMDDKTLKANYERLLKELNEYTTK